MPETASIPVLVVEHTSPEVLLIRISGDCLNQPLPQCIELVREASKESPAIRYLEFDTTGLHGWDSRFVALISRCITLARDHNLELRCEGLPEGVRRLLRLAQILPGRLDAHRGVVKERFLQKVGERAIARYEGTIGLFTFLGQNLLALGNLLRGQAQFRWNDALLIMEESGPRALGIVAMINFLIGLILAFVGATELSRFGASIYVADLVGIAAVRETGSIMTGIILCGRTGAAFAAQLGTMRVNEEINALETFGISPMEFLVLPRMIALILMMPFLCVFANFITIVGGFSVSATVLNVTPEIYWNRTIEAIHLNSFLLGIVKGSFFGFLVAYTGCLRGMQSGYTAAAVGEAATRAVVAGISAIIASDGIFAVLCNALHI